MRRRFRHGRDSRRAAIPSLAVAVLLIVLVAVGALVEQAPAHPPSRKTASAARAGASSPSPSPALPPVRSVVGIGDSVPAGSACDCAPYVQLVAQQVASDTGLDVSVQNLSAPGATSQQLLSSLRTARFLRALRRADLVMMTVGANDLEGLSLPASCASIAPHCFQPAIAKFPAAINKVLAQLRSDVPPHTRIVMTGYWNVFLDGAAARHRGHAYVVNSTALTRRVNSILAAAAQAHGAFYLDTYALFKGDNDADDTALLATDGDHPNAKGHRLIADAAVGVLRLAGCHC